MEAKFISQYEKYIKERLSNSNADFLSIFKLDNKHKASSMKSSCTGCQQNRHVVDNTISEKFQRLE